MPQKTELKMDISRKELDKMYMEEKNPRMKERLLAISLLSEGKSISDVASTLRRSVRSIERWVNAWNAGGYDGLLPKFTGGPKPMLSDEEWDKVLDEIGEKGYDIRQVMVYVNTTRGVQYTYSGVWEVLRRGRKVRYGKPLKTEKNRPSNAEDILKKNRSSNGWA